MNKFLLYLSIISAWALVSCNIQGPWEYTAKDVKTYLGLHSFSYVIAGRPIQNVCFDRMWSLKETATREIAFYKSHDVKVTGMDTSGIVKTVSLQPKISEPNCFVSGDLVGVSNGTYQLNARFVWDSSGTEVTSELSASTQIPTSVTIYDSAGIDSWALVSPSNINVLSQFLRGLPDSTSKYVRVRYEDQWNSLNTEEDTIQWFEDPDNSIFKVVDSLLKEYEETIAYRLNDTLAYAFETEVTHYFNVQTSEDAGNVLVTRKANLLEEESLFVRATNVSKSDLRDSVVLFWEELLEGNNTLYFYAMEPAYQKYLESFIEGNDDPSVIKHFNITGGQGYFVGGIVDSFVVHRTGYLDNEFEGNDNSTQMPFQ